MAKLYFRYGAMNSGKSTALMQAAYNYEENDKKVLVIKSAIDTKGEDLLVSRIGVERKVDKIVLKEHLFPVQDNILDNIDCILVDEAQFLEPYQVDDLYKISKVFDIPIICYGLRTDFKTNGFPGSIRLLEIADQLEELITICSCGKKARFNARIVNGEYIKDGEQVVIDGAVNNTVYKPLCGLCYLEKVDKIKMEYKN